MSLFIGDEQDEPVDAVALHSLATMVLKAEGLPAGSEMAIYLVLPDRIAEYNWQYMQRSGPAEVLAFPLQELEAGKAPARMANEPPLGLGDVFLCPGEIRRRADEAGEDFAERLRLLTVHGILHLLGYDHDTDESATRMEEREDKLLRRKRRRRLW